MCLWSRYTCISSDTWHATLGVGIENRFRTCFFCLFFLKFCIAVHLRHTLCDNSDLQLWGSIMERRKRSKARLHFTKQDENSAVCNQCNAVVSGKDGSTKTVLCSTLYAGSQTHLFRLHYLSTPYLVKVVFSMFEFNMFMLTVLCIILGRI